MDEDVVVDGGNSNFNNSLKDINFEPTTSSLGHHSASSLHNDFSLSKSESSRKLKKVSLRALTLDTNAMKQANESQQVSLRDIINAAKARAVTDAVDLSESSQSRGAPRRTKSAGNISKSQRAISTPKKTRKIVTPAESFLPLLNCTPDLSEEKSKYPKSPKPQRPTLANSKAKSCQVLTASQEKHKNQHQQVLPAPRTPQYKARPVVTADDLRRAMLSANKGLSLSSLTPRRAVLKAPVSVPVERCEYKSTEEVLDAYAKIMSEYENLDDEISNHEDDLAAPALSSSSSSSLSFL